ncbi:hypothetical protein Tco_0535093 [Tanacetum coccineum]
MSNLGPTLDCLCMILDADLAMIEVRTGLGKALKEATLDAFDDLDADGRDYMETEDVVKEGRQSNETKELNKGSGEKGGSTEELVSTAVPKTVSSARPELSTARPDVDAARQEDSMKEEKAKEKREEYTIDPKDIEDSSRPARSILTLKPLPTIDPKDKGKSVLEEPEPAKKMTRNDAIKDSKEAVGVNKQKVLEEPNSTKVEVKQEGHEESIRKRPGRRLKIKATKKSKRQKTDADLEEEEQLKAFLKIVPDEEGIIYYEVLEKRWIKTFSEMVTRFDRLDLVELYKLDLYENYGVHTLILEDGTEIHMLAERKYPLTKETLKRMLSLRLVAGTASEDAYTLLRFIQKQIDEYGSHDGEQMTSGKDFLNPLMADSLCNTPKMGRSGIRISRACYFSDQ